MKRIPFGVLLTAASLATAPFSAFLYGNREYLGFRDIWFYPFMVAGAVLVLGVGAFVVFGTSWGPRVSLILGWGAFALLWYRDVAAVTDRLLAFTGVPAELAWGLVLVVGAGVIYKFAGKRAFLTAVLLFSVTLAWLPLVQYGFFVVTAAGDPTTGFATTDPDEWRSKPDIYYLVLDGFPRADVLEKVYDVDLTGFTETLSDDGFVVADRALAAYPMTWLSVPTVLDQEYLASPGSRGRPATHSRMNAILSGNNRTHRELAGQGYRFVTATEGGGPFCDLSLSPIRDLATCLVQGDSMEAAIRLRLTEMTPLFGLANRGLVPDFLSKWLLAEDLRWSGDNAAGRTVLVDDVLKAVESVKEENGSVPIFVLAHMMHSHPPFTLNSDCGPSSHPGFRPSVDAWDDLVGLQMGVVCAQKQILELVSRVDRDAVIILQSDHGPGRGLLRTGEGVDIHDVPAEDLWVRASVFSAVRLPESCRSQVSDTYAGVNTFRVVFGCMSGSTRELEPSSSFWAWFHDRTIVDVTDRLRQYAGSL